MQFLKIKQKNGEVVTVPIGTEPINSIVSSHNADTSAHADIREQISQLSSEKVVLYSAQTLTDEERAQVRANIGAASAEKETTYTNLAEPIPDNTTDTTKWVNGYRISSTAITTVSGEGKTVCNPIPVIAGDVIRIKGVSFVDNVDRAGLYQADKITMNYAGYVNVFPTSWMSYSLIEGVHVFTVLSDLPSYFRCAFTTPTNPSTVIITKNEEIVESGDTRIEALEVQIEKIEDRVTALENNATVIPDYWEEHIASKITEIKTLQEEGGKDCFSFVTIADMHYPSNLGKNSPILAKEILDKCDIRYALCLGDVQTRGCHATKELLLAENEEIEKMLAPIRDRLLQTEGNHDGSYGLLDRDGNGEYNNRDSEGNVKEPAQRETYVNNLTPAELQSAIYRKVGLVGETHFDESGSGYYIDDTANKVRYIILNTHCNDYELQADGTSKYPKMWLFRFTQPQFDLVIEALNNIPSDSWSVVVAGHCPLYQEIGDREVMQGVLNAYKNKTTYSGEYAGTADSTISYTNLADQSSEDWLNNFRFNSSWAQTAAAGVDVTNFIPVTYHTKLHVKGLDVITDLPNGTNYGRIYFYNNQKEPLEQLTPSGIKQEWFVTAEYNSDVMIIDIANIMAYYNTIQSGVAYIRLGGISSNNIIITDNEEIIGYTIGGYTNQLPLAVDSDKATIYNSKGYKDGARLSSSGGESTITGGFLTGYIPIKIGQTIRLNGNYIKTDWKYYGMANTGFYLEDLTRLSIANMGIFTNNNQYFTNVVTNDEGYVIQFSLNPNWTYLENWSDLAYMRFTLIGSGEDCIITVDEEIVEKEEILPEGGKGYDYVSVDCDFSNAKGELVGYFAGHTHRDAVNSAYGFNIITTRCDGHEENVDGDSSTTEDDALYNERVAGTITEQSFDVFTVNKATHTIYATKIGAGDNRIIKYPASVIGTEPINSIVSSHNADTSAHADIREQINQLSSEKDDLANEVEILKTSVSEGKALIASAVTDKGVQTADDDTFATIAINISNIDCGYSDIPTYHYVECGRVIDIICLFKTAHPNSLIFGAVSDIHVLNNDATYEAKTKESIKHSAFALEMVGAMAGCDFIVNLGDNPWENGIDTENAMLGAKYSINALKPAFNRLTSFNLVGNHDKSDNTQEQYNLIGIHNDFDVSANTTIRGFGYKDYTDKKVRVIVLNTCDYLNASGGCALSYEQKDFLMRALDLSAKTDCAKWQILLLSHIPLDFNGGDYNFYTDLQTILTAYENGTTASITVNSSYALNETPSNYATYSSGKLVYNYSGKNSAKIIANIHGHVHTNKVSKVANTNIARVATANTNPSLNKTESYPDYGDYSITETEASKIVKISGTAKDTSATFYCIDLDEQIIYAYGYGADVDRTVIYKDVPVFAIDYSLKNCTSNNMATVVAQGSTYTANITPNEGAEISSVTVTMGGVDITATAYANGVITIASVTGDIVITAVASVPLWTETVASIAVAPRSVWYIPSDGGVPVLHSSNSEAAIGVTTANDYGNTDRESNTVYVMPVNAKACDVTVTNSDGSNNTFHFIGLKDSGSGSLSVVFNTGKISANTHTWVAGSIDYILISMEHIDGSKYDWDYNDMQVSVVFTNGGDESGGGEGDDDTSGYTNIIDTVGTVDAVRLRSNGAAVEGAGFASNYFPVKAGDIIRVQFPNGSRESIPSNGMYCALYTDANGTMFTAYSAGSNSEVLKNATDTGYEIHIPITDVCSYARVAGAPAGAYGGWIVTVNEEIN